MKTNTHGYQAGMKCACGQEKIMQLPATITEGDKARSVEILAGPTCGRRYGSAV